MTGSLPGGAQALTQDPRLLMAQQLMRQGSSTEPVYSPLEGIARMLTGAVGGYEAGNVRQQNMEALNQAMEALQDTTEPSQLKRMGKASAAMQAGAQFSPNPFLQAQIGLMTKPDVAVPGRDRLVSHDAEGKPIVTLDQAPQSDIGALWKEVGQYKPGSPQFNTTLAKIQKLTMEGGYNVQPGGDMSAAPGGPADPGVVRKLKTSEAGGTGAGELETTGQRAAAAANAALPAKEHELLFGEQARVAAAGKTPQAHPQGSVVGSPEAITGQQTEWPTPGGGGSSGPGRAPASAPSRAPAPAQTDAPAAVAAPQMPVTQGAPQSGPGSVTAPMKVAPGVAQIPTNPIPGAQKEAYAGLIGSDTELLKEARTAAGQAANDGALIQQIRDLAARTKTGWGTEAKLQASRILTTMGASPEQLKAWSLIDPGDGQAMQKNFIRLSAAAARGMGAREPGSVIAMFKDAYPGLETDPRALDLMTNAMGMDAQYRQDRRNAMEGRIGQSFADMQSGKPYTGLLGFDKEFNKTNDPRMYLAAAQVMSGDHTAWAKYKEPAQLQSIMRLIPPGRTFAGPDGRQGWTVPNGG